MNVSRSNRLKFGCPRCMTRLEARLTQAGMRRRCPVCYWEFAIPTAEQIAAVARRSRSEYTLSQGGNRALADSEAYQTYIAVICRVCGTRMYATPEQVGEEMECPDCETLTKVAPPAPAPAASAPHPAPASSDDEYPIYHGAGQSPSGSQIAQQTYIPVICGVCRTRMLATLDQVGQEMNCPDCQTPSIVPPPVLNPLSGPAIPSDSNEQYGIVPWNWWETGQAVPDEPRQVITVCPRCQTRLEIPPAEAGSLLECPDCGTRFDAATRAVERQKKETLEETADEYAIAAPEPVVELKPAVFLESESDPPESPAEEAPRTLRSIPEEQPEKAPRWPFLSGVFSFPFYPGSILYWLVLSVGAVVIVGCAREAYLLTQSGPLAWVVSILVGVIAGLLGLIWMIAASAVGLAIIQDTSDGCDRIVNWPQGSVFEWFPEFLFVLNSVSLSLMVGLGLRSLIGADARLTGITLAGAAYFLFPLILVSMLEGGSPWKPFSLPIWRTLLTVGWAWALFYLETALVGLVIVVPAALFATTHFLFTVPAAAIVVAAMIIYFRLLGRLVWYCAQQLPDEEEEPEDDKQPDEEGSD